MQVVALICARGGSKGLPGKNIRPLAGRPLIAWSIAQARAVARINRVVVSTDSPEIAAVARAAGAEVPFMRPAELAHDASPEWLSWRHALEQLRGSGYPDVLINVPATAPLRLPADLDACLDVYAQGNADMVITVTEAHRNPYFSMVKYNSDGTVGLVMAHSEAVFRRQDAPAVYDITPVAYVTSPDYVMVHSGLFAARTRALLIPAERAVDIDTQLDFTLAEVLIARPQSQTPAQLLT